ncbi:hypothetical protein ACTXG5_22830 [Mycobacterium sp. Dal123C01]|uniref:hypothetical protein n=1 Tax=Mycobacterium sp. Dal123C01 TaxID=3457577 RepID=UPI00403E8A2B
MSPQSKPLAHHNDVPEQDREYVNPTEITPGDYLYDVETDQWVTVDRIDGGPTANWWKLDHDTETGWTFRLFPDQFIGVEQTGGGVTATGNVMRRKHA